MPEKIDILISKHLSGNANSEEKQELESMLESDEQRSEFERAKELWDVSAKLKKESKADVNDAWADFQQRVQVKAPVTSKATYYSYLKIAAGIILLAFLSVIISTFVRGGANESTTIVAVKPITVPKTEAAPVIPDTLKVEVPGKPQPETRVQLAATSKRRKIQQQPAVKMITVAAGDSARAFLLPDNTVVFLNEHSVLSYPENFNVNNRKVSLTGEAYFEVRKDTMQFMVSCRNTVIRGRNASFNIRSYDDNKEVEVIVVSGNAEFSGVGKKEYKKLVLKPDERAIYGKSHDLTKLKNRKDFNWWQKKNLRARIKRFIQRIFKINVQPS